MFRSAFDLPLQLADVFRPSRGEAGSGEMRGSVGGRAADVRVSASENHIDDMFVAGQRACGASNLEEKELIKIRSVLRV